MMEWRTIGWIRAMAFMCKDVAFAHETLREDACLEPVVTHQPTFLLATTYSLSKDIIAGDQLWYDVSSITGASYYVLP